jgi:hypothetical protein
MTPSIVVTYQEFRKMVSTFCQECDTFDSDELDNAHKCIALAYFGLSDELTIEQQVYELPILLNIATQKYFEREHALLNS